MLACFSISTIRHQKIETVLKSSFEGLPAQQRRRFTVVYCTRQSLGMQSEFHLTLFTWHPGNNWVSEKLRIPDESRVIRSFGSGVDSIERWYSRWNRTRKADTSRSVFAAFCDSLCSGEDSYTGGAPQLVGIYRQWTGQTFGVIYKGERYVHGLPVPPNRQLEVLEWRNTLFERCDWETKERIPQAQRHWRPPGLGRA